MFRKLMFWKKKENPIEEVAQLLANISKTSLLGFSPKNSRGEVINPKLVDLDLELFRFKNVTLAPLVMLSGLVGGDRNQRKHILGTIQVSDLREKSFNRYIFDQFQKNLEGNLDADLMDVALKIPDFGPEIWGEPSGDQSLIDHYYRWSQMISFKPTQAQLDKAMAMVKMVAEKRDQGKVSK